MNDAQLELDIGTPIEAEIALIKHIHTMGASVQGMMDALAQIQNIDQRWLNIARTDLQKGFMSAIRAVARPEEF